MISLRVPRTLWSRKLFSTSAVSLSNVKIESVTQLKPRQFPQYAQNPHSFFRNLVWQAPPSNILVVKKPRKEDVSFATAQFISHVHSSYPNCTVIVTEEVAKEFNENPEVFNKSGGNVKHVLYTGKSEEIVSKTDMIVSLGGDGTILRGVSLFSNTQVPPILSFSLGTLGFLLPFDFKDFKEAFKQVFESRALMLRRERLECHIVKKSTITDSNPNSMYRSGSDELSQMHAMNDIVLHRGSLPSLINLDVYVNGHFLTTTTADGLIFATPTGSTAYSLSAGGSMVHPVVPCILLTPVCPRSLSFRPLILPSISHIKVVVRSKSLSGHECSAKLSIDGMPQLKLTAGDEIHVVSESGSLLDPSWNLPTSISLKKKTTTDEAKTGLWCVARTKGDWVTGINNLLGFNSGFKSINDVHP
ncbi:hypothetical protein KL921_004036 [Ogataea angusta]|nr:hypothetical protein KL921_004036 [Ogataea angusta]KAG7828460.1 hypothetical protein KL920_003597 [Ogataea angusta]KAG7838094.1 hypothetical protein KL943_000170 [Ogataea angusta]KAG7844453.1 hypothetical protein KL941_003829 [Ogataea angusta]KAG7857496.1 hypothetical protein KL939_003384 [Ogataea angusta]